MNDDYVIFDDEEDDTYPWKGALVACCISFVIIFCFLIPLVIGWIKMLTWIF